MMDKIVCVKPITKNGNSLTVSITHEIKLMDLDRGDKVKVILERIKEDESN